MSHLPLSFSSLIFQSQLGYICRFADTVSATAHIRKVISWKTETRSENEVLSSDLELHNFSIDTEVFFIIQLSFPFLPLLSVLFERVCPNW